MPFRNQILGFLIRFVVVFGLLIFPSPAWNELYGKGFRAVGNAVFARDDEKCVLYFEGHRQTQGFSAVDTRINIGNRHLVDNNGKGPAAFLVLNTRSVGWLPTALTVALIVATPVPWWRRCWALWGVLLINALSYFRWPFISGTNRPLFRSSRFHHFGRKSPMLSNTRLSRKWGSVFRSRC